MSFEEAHGLVKQQSYLHIHQFSDRNNLSSSKLAQDESDMFTLIDGSDVKYIKHAKDGVRKEWKHKLKLGLGIGIPLTFAVAWVLAFACGWLWSKQRAAKDGGQGVLQGDRVVDSKKGSRERELEST
jgi:hypothetical protein